MTRLTRKTFPRELQIGASAPAETGIVHIGLAQFHRAHAAVATAQALAAEPGPWGIVGVASHSPRVAGALEEQDYLYSILQLTPDGESVGVMDVHRKTLVAAQDPEAVLAEIARPQHRIVTLTVSENGYRKDARTGNLNFDDPAVAADLAEGSLPTTTIGLLARGLQKRFADSGAPLSILSCDNISSAGTTTKMLVAQFLERAGAEPDMLAWMGEKVTFPNAMVDRIVPGTTEGTRKKVQEIGGFWDEVPVPAEAFTMWVIEDNFAAGRPAWEHAKGVIFSDEVERYEEVKLRLLNGSHSLISYLGGLDEQPTIPAARTQPFIEECVRRALYEEFLPSIELPTGFDPDAYIDQLFDRWMNFSLGDKTARVGSDGSAKLLQRVPVPALRLLREGEMPQQMALTVAAWIACVCPPPGFDPGPVAADMVEPKKKELAEAVEGASTVRHHALAIMEGGFFPDELVEHEAFNERVADFLEIIVNDGVRAAAEEALGK